MASTLKKDNIDYIRFICYPKQRYGCSSNDKERRKAMNKAKIKKILDDTAYIRTGGSKEELKCAEYLKVLCEELGADTVIEPFSMQEADIKKEELLADGKKIEAKGYKNCGNADIEAPFYYMPSTDKASLEEACGKIVLIDTGVTYWVFKDLYEAGAKGIITYNGDLNYRDSDIDQKELRAFVAEGKKLPCFNINAKDAVKLVKNGTKTIKMKLSQKEYERDSRNVVATIKGEREEYITFTAHYDSTPLSQGAYDNMTGCIGLLGIMEELAKKTPKYSLKFIFCGSEERGLYGSKSYCIAHEKELEKCVLNINLDMIGSIMGKFIAVCSSEEKLKTYIEYDAAIKGFGMTASTGVYSSDSTPFADRGIPALSFARITKDSIAPIHNRYDTKAVLSADQIAKDIDYIASFALQMANAAALPVKREIPEDIKKKLDEYLNRKRKEN